MALKVLTISSLLLLLIVKPGGGTVIFRYYLLGGDTAAPSGLNARLCHAFLVSFFFIFSAILEKNYLRKPTGHF